MHGGLVAGAAGGRAPFWGEMVPRSPGGRAEEGGGVAAAVQLPWRWNLPRARERHLCRRFFSLLLVSDGELGGGSWGMGVVQQSQFCVSQV